MESAEEIEKSIEQWKVKRLIENLEKVRGNGTSLISLVIPPKDQLPLVNKQITEEIGKASNIKSRVVRQAVESALVSVKEKLKLYNNRLPPNGLIVYCGEVFNEQEIRQKKVTVDIQPFKPINTSRYLCDNKFDTQPLRDLLENDDKFGFIIVDGNGTLYGTLQGNTRDVLHKFTVDLPKKHRRGGQSAPRFGRIRMEARQHYLRKVAETALSLFIANDRVTVSGLVIGGSAEFKKELNESDRFDPRLKAKVLTICDVSYGGENGFNQAIELVSETLANVKFVREQKLISKFFSELAQDTKKYCYSVQDTIKALEMGAVETLLLYENLAYTRYTVFNKVTGERNVLILSEEEEKDSSHFHVDGVDLDIEDQVALSEWVVDNYASFGASLEFITDRSSEGSQFVRGFGGLGGFLRYKLDMNEITVNEEDLDDDWDDDFM